MTCIYEALFSWFWWPMSFLGKISRSKSWKCLLEGSIPPPTNRLSGWIGRKRRSSPAVSSVFGFLCFQKNGGVVFFFPVSGRKSTWKTIGFVLCESIFGLGSFRYATSSNHKIQRLNVKCPAHKEVQRTYNIQNRKAKKQVDGKRWV